MSRKKNQMFSKIEKRMYIMAIVCSILYGFLIYRLSDIQVINQEKYKLKAESQSTEKIELNSGRGIIYDRNNKPLTDREKKKVLIVQSKKINDHKTIELIKKATNMDELEIWEAVQLQNSQPIIQIETDYIRADMKEELKENDIIVDEKTIRYSDDGLLSHTIGYIQKSDKSAQSGIEKSMDEVLKNSNEEYISAFKAGDSGNRDNIDILKGSVKKVKNNENDRHLRLTIDYDIQKKVEKIVDKEENPTAVVISDIETGEVISISSRPNFNQNNIADAIANGQNRELENRATKCTYPPGSIFKIVVLFAALEDGAVDSNYTYNCTGKTKVGNSNEILHCHKENGHGIETLEDAFSNSCNPAFLDIATKVGEDKILEAARKLHLEDEVDIGIEETSKKIPNDISIRNLAIGQDSMEFTPLQINQLTQIIANNGTYKPLYLYDSIIDNDKKIVKTFKTSKSEEIIYPYYITQIKEMMKSVAKEGTGRELADLPGGCGVKTGTAQSTLKKKKINHGWITGYYPEKNSKYAITVLVEGTESSSKSAIPIFKEICQEINKK